jgi:hypothetical protein
MSEQEGTFVRQDLISSCEGNPITKKLALNVN